MATERITDWFLMPESERPAVTFLGYDVISVTPRNGDINDYVITVKDRDEEATFNRNWQAVLHHAPVKLDAMTQMTEMDFALAATTSISVVSVEAKLAEEWCPGVCLTTATFDIYVVQTTDGPKIFKP